MNVQRLQAYKAKLIVFPRKASKPKKTDSDAALLKEATQLQGKLMPLSKPSAFTEAPRAITAEEKNASAYATLRNAQSVAKYVGIRAKRLKEKQAAEEQKAKA
jgi:large subunit ribosomal protein L13e